MAFPSIYGLLAVLYLTLGIAAARSDKASASTSAGSNLNFVVPTPVAAPGTNTSSGCGQKLESDLQAGSTQGPFTFKTTDGYGRTYAVYIPKTYDVNKASPLVFGLPGNKNTYADIANQTELSNPAMNPYAIAVFVTGYNLGFVSNPGYGATQGATYPKIDDLAFMDDFIDNLTSRLCVDTGRIWAIGHSNGGGLANVMACDPVLSKRISAFAANSGAFYTNATDGNPNTISTDTTVQSNCSPARKPIPFIEFHGTADATIDYDGTDNHSSYGVRVLPDIPHWASQWSVRNGYSANNVTTQPEKDVTVYQWGPPENLGVVTHYKLTGWIHDYARIAAGAPIDATPIIMQFFYNQTNFTTTSTTPTSSGSPSGTQSAHPSSTTSSAAAGRTAGISGTSLVGLLIYLFCF